MRLTPQISALLFVAACGGGQTPQPGPVEPAPSAAEGPAARAPDVSDWRGWTKLSDQIFASRGHKKQPADLYVPADGADWYRSLAEGAVAPVGFKVAKIHYRAMDGAEPTTLMVMAKMPAGYDPDHGDWFYGVYDPSGSTPAMSGAIEMCINCHSASDDTDYLVGLPK